MLSLPLALLLFATPAQSTESGYYKDVRGWSIFRNDKDCAAISMFENKEALGFNYNAKKRTTEIFFTYKDGTSLVDADTRTLAVYIEEPNGQMDDGWDSVEFTALVAKEKAPLLWSQPLKDPALEDFKRATKMAFFYNDKKIATYNLSGTGAALLEVERCSQQLHNINPNDVFSQ